MNTSQDKTVVVSSQGGGDGGTPSNRALPNGYTLQGRYIIERQLGAGGFGITYLAKHRYLEDLWVAIKEYLPEGAAERDASSRVHPISAEHEKIYSWGLHRFLDEARLLRQFQHPNIVSVEDFFEANETAYMVMNYVPGRSIQSELEAGRQFTEEDLRSLVYQLFDALSQLHRKGLYHRDISPDNILLREDDSSPVLIDFGSARYEMRMRGAAQADEQQLHRPTTIFKPGYSPIEQYEGTTQGPYTDIYAFAATLYRMAFGARPVDALKRSGEIRLTQTDPLVPASVRGADSFSDDFLKVLDVGLRLDPTSRPKTIEHWLEKLKDVPRPTLGATPAPSGRRSVWPALALSAALVGIAALGGFLWYQREGEPKPLPTDINELLTLAGAEFEAEPFDETRQSRARQLYLHILNQDGFETRALAGLKAANLLQEFTAAVAAEERAEAVILLDEIEAQFKQAGIDIGTIETGWQRVELLNKVAAFRSALPAAPLSDEAIASAKALLSEMQPLPGGNALTTTGLLGVRALEAARDALSQDRFDDARTQIGVANRHLAELGVTELTQAARQIDEQQSAYELARRAQAKATLERADQSLLSDPLSRESLIQSSEAYAAVLALDAENSQAEVRRTLAEKLLAGFDLIDQGRFVDAREVFASARKVAVNSEITALPVDRADSYLATQERQRALAQTRQAIQDDLAEGTRLLDSDPLDAKVIEQASAVYRDAFELGDSDPSLVDERRTAESGLELASLLGNLITALDDARFSDARRALERAPVADWAEETGQPHTLASDIGRAISAREIDWLRRQAIETLGTADPLAPATPATAGQPIARLLELVPDHPEGLQLRRGVELLAQAQSAQQAGDYAVALEAIREANGLLQEAGVEGARLADALELLARSEAERQRRAREQRILALSNQAFDILKTAPFSEASQNAAARVFNAIGAIDGGREAADLGERLLTTLRGAGQALVNADFETARASVRDAEQLLSPYGIEGLDIAWKRITQAQEAWIAKQSKERERLLAQVTTLLGEPGLDSAVLDRIEETYRTMATLSEAETLSDAGIALVRLLRESIEASQANDHQTAQDRLADASRQLATAGLDPAAITPIATRLDERRLQWEQMQRLQAVEALVREATGDVTAAPLDAAVLRDVAERLTRATNLSRELGDPSTLRDQVSKALESVFLLQAFAAELEDRQFDALRQTITQLRGRLPGSGLDEGLPERLDQIADAAELAWLMDTARSELASIDWSGSTDLSAVRSTIEAAAAIAPADAPEIAAWQSALQLLDLTLAEHGQQRYDAALQQLALARQRLEGLKVDTAGMDRLADRIAGEGRRWEALSVARTLVARTGAAIAVLESAPFDQRSWQKVEADIAAIFAARPDDYRGVALVRALEALSGASTALDAQDFEQAFEQTTAAQEALMSLGLQAPLQRAVDDVQLAAQRQHARQVDRLVILIETRPISDDGLAESGRQADQLSRVAAVDSTWAIGTQGLRKISEAWADSRQTRYATADERLAEAEQLIGGLPDDFVPLPALRRLLADTQADVDARRPSPGEIYPIISVGLRTIAESPLDGAGLDTAESLLQNALGLQADEQTAIEGLRTIESLRAAAAAIESGDGEQARASLQQAQDTLASIGLASTTLQAAWQRVQRLAPPD